MAQKIGQNTAQLPVILDFSTASLLMIYKIGLKLPQFAPLGAQIGVISTRFYTINKETVEHPEMIILCVWFWPIFLTIKRLKQTILSLV